MFVFQPVERRTMPICRMRLVGQSPKYLLKPSISVAISLHKRGSKYTLQNVTRITGFQKAAQKFTSDSATPS